jgi:hypothetical protein
MTTNAQYFTRALQDINVLSESESPSAEQSADMLTILNNMRGSLLADGIDFGIAPQTSATDTLLLNEGDREDFHYLLCVRAAVAFNKQLRPDVAVMSQGAYLRQLRKAINGQIKPSTLKHTPYGAAGDYDITRGY